MDKESILRNHAEMRNQEIAEYQLNIDNYALALAKIRSMSESEQKYLEPFILQLSELLESALFEQKKSKIMLEVVLEQLGGN